MKQNRINRINKLIQKKLSSIIKNEILNNKNNIITITNIKTTTDLSQAKIFITALNSERKIIDLLNKSTKYLRNKLAHNINLYKTPKLYFFIDEKENFSKKIIELLDNK